MKQQEELHYVLGLRFKDDIDRDLKLTKIKGVFECNDEGAKVILNNSETHGDIVATPDQLHRMGAFGIYYTSAYTQAELNEQHEEEQRKDHEATVRAIEKEEALTWYRNLPEAEQRKVDLYVEHFTVGPARG